MVEKSDMSSPESDVPEIVAGGNPHRWSRKETSVAHVTVVHWEPEGSLTLPATSPVPLKFAARKPTERVRTLRSRASESDPISSAINPEAPKYTVMGEDKPSDGALRALVNLIYSKYS